MDTDNNNKSKSLEKKVLSLVQVLFPYVRQRLKVAVSRGVLPKNMYQPNGIIDEVILNVYEENMNENTDLKQLMLTMFSICNIKLNKLYEKERFHTKTISIKSILDEEMASLEEKFTVDGGFDLIMDDELDDISYHQDTEEHNLLRSDEFQQNIADFLEIKNNDVFKDEQKQNILQKMYLTLPFQTSNIVDLYVLGKLNLQEVATIVNLDISEVKRIIDFVKKNFKKHLI